MSARVVSFGVIALAILALVIGVGKCADRDDMIENAVDAERKRVADSVRKEFEPVIDSLRRNVTVRVDTVRRFSTRWDTVRRLEVDTVFARDSAGAVIPAVPFPQYEAVVAAGDSLKAACTLLASSCEQLRDSVPKLVTLYRASLAARDSLIAHPKPPRRWSLCGSAGYGVVLGNPVRTGPTASLGVCYRIF